MEELKRVKDIFTDIQNVSSIKAKEYILKQNADNELFKECLRYTYDKDKKFKVSKKSILLENGTSKWNNLFDMLDELAESNINKNLKSNVNRFLHNLDEDVRQLVINILCKDLKCGISIKTINKVFAGLVFDFKVMKASAWNEKTKPNFIKKAKSQGYMAMIKENGERFEIIKENGKVIIKSRQNKVFEDLNDLKKAFEFMPDNTFYEGEGLAFNPNGEEWETSEDQFKLTNKILHTIGVKEGIFVKLFDMLPLEDFREGYSNIKAKDRKSNLRLLVEEYSEKHKDKLIQFADIIYEGKDVSVIEDKLTEVSNNSYKEGLMVQLNDSPYEAKRVNHNLKVKLWHTMDLEVIDLKESLEKPNTLGSLVLDYKGERQGASGISDMLKDLWWNNPDEILGKIVEVKYKAITKDKEGNESLQFCTFIRVREEGKEVSYE